MEKLDQTTDQGPEEDLWTVKVQERHIATRFNLDGRVLHRMAPSHGKTLIIHLRERSPQCRICRALGVDGREERR